MELKFFADIIKEVLVRNDVACLPGLGAFVTEEVPAYFSDKGFTINPPYLKPVFKAEITKDMGLVDFYAANNSISRSASSSVLTETVQALRAELTASRAVLLPDLGYLRLTHDGNIFFVPCEGLDIFPHFDSLESVSLRNIPLTSPVSVAKEVASPVDAEKTAVETVITPAETKASVAVQETAAWLKWLLVLLALVILFFALLAIAGRLYPELVDPFLYDARELEIVKQIV